jgi:hypothetical protein
MMNLFVIKEKSGLEPITKQFNFEQTFQMKNFQDAYKSVQ